MSLAHVDHLAQRLVADSLTVRRELVMDTIRSLIIDGVLIVVGHIVGGSDERVEPWDASLDDAIWFALTERGDQATEPLETKESEG